MSGLPKARAAQEEMTADLTSTEALKRRAVGLSRCVLKVPVTVPGMN